MKKNRWLAGIIGLLIAGTVSFPAQAQETNIRKQTMTYQTNDKTEEKQFPKEKTFDGQTYQRKHVTYEVLKEEPGKEKKKAERIIQSAPLVKGTDHPFPKEETVDGGVYRLQEVTEREIEPYRQNVSGYNEYGYEISRQAVPQTKEISVKNEKTGEEETVSCRLSEVRLADHVWVDSDIAITFQGYDSNSLEWQGLVLANDMGENPLTGYETELLQSVELSDSTGQVSDTYWTSGTYINEEGSVCRDAKADIQKLVPVYRAEYQGEIVTSYVVKTAVYQGEQETDSETDINYTIKATAVYEKTDNHLPYIFAGVGILIAVALIIVILMILAKKGKEKRKHATA